MRRVSFMLLALCIPMLSMAQTPAAAPAPANLTILTDADLLLPLSQLARDYAVRHGTPLTVAIADAAHLPQQIGQGLEAHVLLTADHALITQLAEQGVTDVSSVRPIARTQLALAGPVSMKKSDLLARHISFAALLQATADAPIYLRTPDTQDGAQAAKLRKGFEFSALIDARAMEVDSPLIAMAEDSPKPALALVRATEALSTPGAMILSLLPEDISPAARYDAVVLASESMDDSRALVRYLTGGEAQKILSHYGFQSAGE